MSDPFAHVSDGDALVIPAAAYNGFCDAARWVKSHAQQGVRSGKDRPGPNEVKVQNDSGGDLDRFAVLGINDILISPADNEEAFAEEVLLSGVTPGAVHLGLFVVLAEPIADGAIGRAYINGVCPAWIKGEGDYVDVEDGTTDYLIAVPHGSARVVWPGLSGDDERYAVIRFGDSCPQRNEIHQWAVLGAPTGGSFKANYTVKGVTEELEIDYDAIDDDVLAEIESHSEVGSGNVSVTGGPLPNATIEIQFIGDLAGVAVPLPLMDWDDLTGGSGVAVIPSRPQPGFPF